MTKFDYRDNSKNNHDMKEVWSTIDALSDGQLEKIGTLAKEMKQQAEEERRQQVMEWLRGTVMPVVKAFAEANNALLEMDEDENGCMNVSVHGKGSLDFEGNKQMKLLVALSDCVWIDVQEEDVVLQLVFDCGELV